MAEEVGFEPTDGFPSTVFKTAAFNHSAIPPFSIVYTIFSKCVNSIYNKSMNDIDYMKLALEQARIAYSLGEVPIGALVVYQPFDKGTRKPLADAKVISRAYNLRESTNNPAAHAEFLAIQKAAQKLNTWRLVDCTVYVTLEPCVMCAGLMHQSRIKRCVYAAYDKKAGALGTLYAVHEDKRLNHCFEVTSGVLEEESVCILKDFFKNRRAKQS